MIQAHGLTKRYPQIAALNGISFSVEAGEIFGFLGPNGAGKTTTIKILTGQVRPTGGRASVAGIDVVTDRERLHHVIGVVFDIPTLYEEHTALRNLTLFCDLYGEPRRRADELLESVGLGAVAKRPVRKMSRGMKQRVMIARALIPNPRVLFLDEPTGGLDPESAADLKRLIRRLADGGTTVFLTTHRMEVADQLCSRVAIVDHGRVIAVASPEALKRRNAIPLVQVELRDGSRVTLPLSDGQLGARLHDLGEQGIERIQTIEPTLEDVLLSLTGRGRQ
ncbi:MAG: ABC transporter ATP-binding protein [Chloroflexota bacterium]